MRLKSEQLSGHLQRGLAPIYLVFGDEPLQRDECCDAIRRRAKDEGYLEREVFSVEAGFAWESLLQSANSMSLFAERRLLDLRLPTGKPGTEGGKVFQAYAQNPPEDTILLISSGKVDSRSQKSKWFASLEKAGVAVPVWPIDAARLPTWVDRRMRNQGLIPEPGVTALLADRVEGNLLAAAQEVDKLALLFGEGKLDLDSVQSAVSDSARFDLFELVDYALAGQASRCQRMLRGLRGEGEPPALVLWAITKEVRELLSQAYDVASGQSINQVQAQRRVWEKRKRPMAQALQRYQPQQWMQLLEKCASVDQMVKGMAAGDVWDELLQLLLQIGGVWVPGNVLMPASRMAGKR